MQTINSVVIGGITVAGAPYTKEALKKLPLSSPVLSDIIASIKDRRSLRLAQAG